MLYEESKQKVEVVNHCLQSLMYFRYKEDQMCFLEYIPLEEAYL